MAPDRPPRAETGTIAGVLANLRRAPKRVRRHSREVYRDRGLLPPPLRVGRIALFNDTHLTRLRLITSMLDRGYNIAHVREMLSAWEHPGRLFSALAGSRSPLTRAHLPASHQVRRQRGQLLAGLLEFAIGIRGADDAGSGPKPGSPVAFVGCPQG
jgi:DNA-binding transcriptional MerR regulator